MSRAEYLRTWREAYPHKVREYNRTARLRAGVKVRAEPEPESREARKRRKSAEASRRYRARQRAVRSSTQVDCFMCNVCGEGPCKGVCDGN
jgi:ferric-dicitrate binding protein FerR (iron transport regulator)